MKRLFAILLPLTMLLSLAACGGSAEEDPNAGKYIGVSAAVGGFSMPMSDIYPGETWIELKSGGKGTIMLDGDDFKLKWSLEGEDITIALEGVDSVGTLVDGVITVDLMNMGCVMTFELEGGSIADKVGDMVAPASTYNDAGYYDLIRIDVATEEDSVSEEDLTMLRELGILMYLELLEDGTGVLFMEEEMPVTWADGTVNFTEDNMSISYTLENGDLVLDMLESVLVFRKGEKPTEPVAAIPEMEAAGFTEFMELGVSYPYTTACSKDETQLSVGEAKVSRYEVFESSHDHPAKEGYEWRIAEIQTLYFDDNARKFGVWTFPRTEDYYNVKLLDDTARIVEEEGKEDTEVYSIIWQGQEMEVYYTYNSYWSNWVNHVCTNTQTWEFQVPVGYDGCVIGLWDNHLNAQWESMLDCPDDLHITDVDPSHFLLFRLN